MGVAFIEAWQNAVDNINSVKYTAETMSSKPPTRAERIQQKSAERREQKKEALRREILAAATKLFEAHGYEQFSLRQVAEQVGYSPTTIYLYFANKDDLLFEVVYEGCIRFGEMLEAAYHTCEDPAERLEAIGRAYLEFGLTHPLHYRLMFMQRGEFMTRTSSSDRKPPIDSFQVLVQAVEEALAAGVLASADPLTWATLFWTGVHGIVSLAISMPVLDEEKARHIAELYFPTIREGFLHSR